MEIRGGRRVGAPRIDHDELRPRVPRAGILDPAEEDRVRPCGVGPRDKEQIRVIDVGVAGGRRVGAERQLVAGDRRGHAQPRVGVDVVGADQRPGELVEDVVVLDEELARDVEPDRVGAVGPDDVGEPPGGVVERLVPARPGSRRRPAAAQLGVQRARVVLRREVEGRALGAEPPEIRRVIGVAAHAGHATVVCFDDHPAAHAAIAAGGLRLGHVPHSMCCRCGGGIATHVPRRTRARTPRGGARAQFRSAAAGERASAWCAAFGCRCHRGATIGPGTHVALRNGRGKGP